MDGESMVSTADWVKRGPEWVTKTNIRDYEQCPYGFWLMHSGAVKREDVFGPMERALIAAGNVYEARLLEEMPDIPPGLPTGQMREVARFVYDGPTVENVQRKLVGRPDGIDLDAQAPIEIKSHMRPRTLDKYELAFYWWLLEPFRMNAACEPYGWLSLGFGEPVCVQLTNRHFERVDHLIRSVRKARINGVEPRVCSCVICLTRPEVQELKRNGTDVALVFGVGPERIKTLSQLGIRTINELSEADPDLLAERVRSSEGSTLSAKTILLWQHHARALRGGTPVRFTSERFDQHDFVALDLEYDSLAGQGEVWLIGALVQRDGEVEVFQTLCESASELKRGLIDFAKLLQKHHDLPIITWNGGAADVPNLQAAAKARRVKVMHLVSHRHVDLYRLVCRSLRLPIPGLDLKSVATYLGFERTSDISGGFEAVTLFHQFLGSKNSKLRKRLREDLLGYNREDLEALRAVAEFLRVVSPVGVAPIEPDSVGYLKNKCPGGRGVQLQ